MKRKGKHNTNRTIRKPYRNSRRFDASCRCHGSCSYCRSNRLHKNVIAEISAKEQMNEALNNIARNMFGRERHGDVCVTCGGMVGEFRDDLSRKEYTISGMCQECQDTVFGIDSDE